MYLPYTLGADARDVSLRIVKGNEHEWYRKFDQRHRKAGSNDFRWCGENRTHAAPTPGTYRWSVLVQWNAGGQWMRSNSQAIDVRG